MLVDKITKDYVEILELPNTNWIGNSHYLVDSNSELATKIKSLHPNFDFILDDNGNLIDVSVNISFIKQNKITEMDNICKQTIYNGIDITLSDGTVEHFTLDEQDQLNLSGLGLELLSGAEQIAWHEDDETVSCRFYSARDAQTIIGSLTTYKSYHITYFRDLRIYINSLTDENMINNISYGDNIPEEFKSEVLKSYEEKMNSVNGD